MRKNSEKRQKKGTFSSFFIQFTHMYVNEKCNYVDILHAKTGKNSCEKAYQKWKIG